MMLMTGTMSAVRNAVLKELLARKIPVRAFVRKPSVAEKLEAQGVETFLGDMTERESVQKALQGIERVSLIPPSLRISWRSSSYGLRKPEKLVYTTSSNGNTCHCDGRHHRITTV
ncbi:SDR family oxidoreductase [Ktedonobacter sp. SOSP1-52]|uniref:SDR family oxidoreductase n=1 Tax=Ktedonobacter sp. SOSP1-52 TaxID=2778366 RepID=UPI0019157714|nr:NAD(P)H-binding protein [Ktedonobacter sp. SOSP1-52]